MWDSVGILFHYLTRTLCSSLAGIRTAGGTFPKISRGASLGAHWRARRSLYIDRFATLANAIFTGLHDLIVLFLDLNLDVVLKYKKRFKSVV